MIRAGIQISGEMATTGLKGYNWKCSLRFGRSGKSCWAIKTAKLAVERVLRGDYHAVVALLHPHRLRA